MKNGMYIGIHKCNIHPLVSRRENFGGWLCRVLMPCQFKFMFTASPCDTHGRLFYNVQVIRCETQQMQKIAEAEAN